MLRLKQTSGNLGRVHISYLLKGIRSALILQVNVSDGRIEIWILMSPCASRAHPCLWQFLASCCNPLCSTEPPIPREQMGKGSRQGRARDGTGKFMPLQLWIKGTALSQHPNCNILLYPPGGMSTNSAGRYYVYNNITLNGTL